MRDNGKLYAEMSAQTAYMAQWYHYYGGLADKIEGAGHPDRQARHVQLHALRAARRRRRDHAVEFAAAADRMEAGARARRRQHVVIKPSEFTSASLLEFMKLIEEAGFPPGVVNVVTGFGAEVGTPLVEHPLVAKVAFTGSDADRPENLRSGGARD